MHWIARSDKDSVGITLEKRLWDAANQFRANSGLKSQEYSAPVLGRILQRFAERDSRSGCNANHHYDDPNDETSRFGFVLANAPFTCHVEK
jgi:hypothetical protein